MKRSVILILSMFFAGAALAVTPPPQPVAAGCPTNALPSSYVGSPAQKAAIHSNFNRVILCNLQHNPNVNMMIANMQPIDLARLSTQIDLTAKTFASMGTTNVPTVAMFLQTTAQKLTAPNLMKIRSAFGGTETDSAVAKFSSLSIQSTYFSAVQKAPLRLSRAQILSNGLTVKAGTVTTQGTVVPAPVLDMTLYEVYLDYYTAGWSASASLGASAIYISGNLTAAFSAGYLAGTGIYWITDKFTPEVNIWIGDQIGPIVDVVCKGGECK